MSTKKTLTPQEAVQAMRDGEQVWLRPYVFYKWEIEGSNEWIYMTCDPDGTCEIHYSEEEFLREYAGRTFTLLED
jgi:hypothetical protein